jgi:hypothetical protein
MNANGENEGYEGNENRPANRPVAGIKKRGRNENRNRNRIGKKPATFQTIQALRAANAPTPGTGAMVAPTPGTGAMVATMPGTGAMVATMPDPHNGTPGWREKFSGLASSGWRALTSRVTTAAPPLFNAFSSGASAVASGASAVASGAAAAASGTASFMAARRLRNIQQSNAKKLGQTLRYVPAYKGNMTNNRREASRENVASGEMMVKWLDRTMKAMEKYRKEYAKLEDARTKVAAEAALPLLAEQVLNAYAHYYMAQIKHALEKSKAPRAHNEESNIDEPELYLSVIETRRSLPARKVLELEQGVNTVVQAFGGLAAQYGFQFGGANAGPKLIGETEQEKIASQTRMSEKITGTEDAGTLSVALVQYIIATRAAEGGRRGKTRRARKQKKTRKHKHKSRRH